MSSSVQKSFENFEDLKFEPFESKSVILHDSSDPDKNYNKFQPFTRIIISHSSIPPYLKSFKQLKKIFLMVHLSTRSTKKNFKRFKDFLSQTGSFFNPFQPEVNICAPFSCYVILRASAAVQINQNGR